MPQIPTRQHPTAHNGTPSPNHPISSATIEHPSTGRIASSDKAAGHPTSSTPTQRATTSTQRTVTTSTNTQHIASSNTGTQHTTTSSTSTQHAVTGGTDTQHAVATSSTSTWRVAAPGRAASGHLASSTTRHLVASRIATAAATVTALLAILLTSLALPAQAATNDANTSSGIGTQPTHHPVASRPTNPADGLTVGALCLAGIVATAAGVLWYTARTRRTLDSDPS